jgi:hypothetical protein
MEDNFVPLEIPGSLYGVAGDEKISLEQMLQVQTGPILDALVAYRRLKEYNLHTLNLLTGRHDVPDKYPADVRAMVSSSRERNSASGTG